MQYFFFYERFSWIFEGQVGFNVIGVWCEIIKYSEIMDPQQAHDRITFLKNLIVQEAENQSQELEEEAQAMANERKNKVFAELREKLITEFAKKEENNQTEIKTQRSRRVNNSRLEVQEERQKLLSDLREEIKNKIKEKITDKNFYKALLKNLIVQVMTAKFLLIIRGLLDFWKPKLISDAKQRIKIW